MDRRDFIRLASGGFIGLSVADVLSAERLLGQTGIEKVSKVIGSVPMKNHVLATGLNKDYVEVTETFNKAHPTAEKFRDRLTGEVLHEFHGLKRAREDDGTLITAGMTRSLGKHTIDNNLFEGDIEDGGRIAFAFTGDSGAETFVTNPTVKLGAIEMPIVSGPILHAIDPLNSYYSNNVIDFNYGIVTRRIRIIEGRMQGRWIFASNPGNDVTLKYNRQGKGVWRLGQYQVGPDTEFISRAVFDDPDTEYPFEINDDFVPAAGANSPVDGNPRTINRTSSWADHHDETTADAADPTTISDAYCGWEFRTSPNFKNFWRSYFLFDTSALTVEPGSVTLNCYFQALRTKDEGGANTLVYVITSGVPTGDADLVVGDIAEAKFGATAWSNDKAWGSIATDQYDALTFNATGRTNVNLSGLSRFSIRDKNHDIADATPAHGAEGQDETMGGYFADQGAANDPTLTTGAAVGGGPASTAGIASPASVGGVASPSKIAGIE